MSLNTYQVVFSKRAQNKLSAIYDYLSEKTSPSYAQKIKENIINKTKELAEAPHSFPAEGQTLKKGQFHHAVVWQYKIMFTINEHFKEVTIVEIIKCKNF